MSGDSKRGDAVADKWREAFEKNRRETDLSLTRLDVRTEMRSADFEEVTDVINARADERLAERPSSDPPAKPTPLVVVLTVARKFPPWGAVIVALAAIAAYVYLRR